MERNLTQAKLAEMLGVSPATIGNMESSNHIVIREDRAVALSRAFGLGPDAADEFVAAWRQLPVSEYAKKLRKTWAKKSEMRGKVKHYDRMKLSLLEVLAVMFSTAADPETLCICEFDDFTRPPGTGRHPSDSSRPCELCYALQALGLDGWTDLADVTSKLAALQEKIEKAMAKTCAPPDERVTG